MARSISDSPSPPWETTILTYLVGIAFWFWGLSLLRARQVKQTNYALQENALHTQTILDNMVDGVITIDERSIIKRPVVRFVACVENVGITIDKCR